MEEDAEPRPTLDSLLTDISSMACEVKDLEAYEVKDPYTYLEQIQSFCNSEMLPLACEIVSSSWSNQEEFDQVQTTLAKFLLNEGSEKSSFLLLDFISRIFGFICKIAPSELIEEYALIFSNPKMLAQVKLMILPEIQRYVPVKSNDDPPGSELDLIIRFGKIQFQCEGKQNDKVFKGLSPRDSSFIALFWKNLTFNWNPELAQRCIPICLNFIEILCCLDPETLWVVMVAVLKTFLLSPVSEMSCVATSVLLLGFARCKFKSGSPSWMKMSQICQGVFRYLKLQSTGSETLNVFGFKCLTKFLDSVQVDSKFMVRDLILALSKDKDVLDLNDPHPRSSSISVQPTLAPSKEKEVSNSNPTSSGSIPSVPVKNELNITGNIGKKKSGDRYVLAFEKLMEKLKEAEDKLEFTELEGQRLTTIGKELISISSRLSGTST